MLLDPTVLSHFRNIVHYHLEVDVDDLHSVVYIIVVAVHLVRIATNALVLLKIELIVSVLNVIEISCALLSFVFVRSHELWQRQHLLQSVQHFCSRCYCKWVRSGNIEIIQYYCVYGKRAF